MFLGLRKSQIVANSNQFYKSGNGADVSVILHGVMICIESLMSSAEGATEVSWQSSRGPACAMTSHLRSTLYYFILLEPIGIPITDHSFFASFHMHLVDLSDRLITRAQSSSLTFS